MTLALGSKPKPFSLRGIDDKIYSLDDFKKTYIAIMFSCNHCPYVVGSEREFVQLQKEFMDDFTLIAINSNEANPDYPTDSFDNMKARAEEKGFNFPYLVDDTQDIARAYSAGRTPEIFLYNEHRVLVFKGRIKDNPKKPQEVSRHDLREALLELKAGKPISIPETQAIGCSIKFME